MEIKIKILEQTIPAQEFTIDHEDLLSGSTEEDFRDKSSIEQDIDIVQSLLELRKLKIEVDTVECEDEDEDED